METQSISSSKALHRKSGKFKIVTYVLIVSLASLVGFLYVWANNPYLPNEQAKLAMKDSMEIKVTKNPYIEFNPTGVKPTKGFIFYPGGKVDEQAYAPLCRRIAEAGYKVVIVPMPLDLAVFGKNKAEQVILDFPEIKEWAIGGHSLGGVMASSFAANNEMIKGIVFYASYPSGDELKNTDKKVLSIYGTRDGVANLESVKGAASKLPKDAQFISIPGGNHGQFGSYGFQSGDNKATISPQEQMEAAAQATIQLLEKL